MTEQTELEARIRSGVPHSARVWNYWIGGKDHYPVDQELGDQVIASYPQTRDLARASRAFQARAVRYLADEAGITQFLDIGTGLPVQNSTHEVAQSVQPKARIVYVDNDPLVLAHARALLTSAPDGVTEYVHADMLEAEQVLQEASRTLDMTQPVAVMVLSTLGHVEPRAGIDLMRRYMAGTVTGSYLVLCDTVATPRHWRPRRPTRPETLRPTWCAGPRRSSRAPTGWSWSTRDSGPSPCGVRARAKTVPSPSISGGSSPASDMRLACPQAMATEGTSAAPRASSGSRIASRTGPFRALAGSASRRS